MILEEYLSCVVKLLNSSGMSWIVRNHSYVRSTALTLRTVASFHLILLRVIKITTCPLLSKGLKIHASPSEGRKHQVLLGRTLKAKLDSWRSMRFNDVPNVRVGNVNSQQISCIKMTCGEVRGAFTDALFRETRFLCPRNLHHRHLPLYH